MAVTINSSTTSGAIISSDNTGITVLQANSVTSLTADGTGRVILPQISSFSTIANGALEYSTINSGYIGAPLLYFTQNTQRNLIPFASYYGFSGGQYSVGANTTAAQPIFGSSYMNTGITVQSYTAYAFESLYLLTKTGGTTSHTISLGFSGTASANYNIFVNETDGNGTYGPIPTSTPHVSVQTSNSNLVVTGAMTATNQVVYLFSKGIINVTTGGTILPTYSLSAAIANSYTTQSGSYVSLYPISPNGGGATITNIGGWS
jgi:hypothetical protein